jgi:anti-sigma factor RsiW
MTCRELTDFLDDYLDGSLAAQARATFDTHIGECPECATYLATYAATIRLAKVAAAEPDRPIPCGVPEELVQAILAARRRL